MSNEQEQDTEADISSVQQAASSTAEAGDKTNIDNAAESVTRRLEQLKEEYGSTWNGPDDPEDPYNWAAHRKIITGLIYSVAELVTLMTASIISAALNDIVQDLDISTSTGQMIFSTYILGLGFGPLIIASLAELHGRKWVWVAGNLWFVLWNAISPVGKSADMMIVCRLMAGIGASAGVTLTGPVMADMYGRRDRGKAAAIASLLPSLGPALGPIIGGVITQLIEWPWIFRIMSIVTLVLTSIGVLYIRESYTPALLQRKTRGSGAEAAFSWRGYGNLWSKLAAGVWRPLRLLLFRPVIQIISLNMALSFGIYSILLGTYASLFIDKYGESQAISSLHYISIAMAMTLSAQVGGYLMDRLYRNLADYKNDGVGKPEFRVPYLAVGTFFLPVGIILYGWAAEYKLPWPVVDLGTAVFAFGSVVTGQTLLAYQMDEFVEHAASASAATRMPSYILGFAFPIFAPQLYQNLGYGWGSSMLAFIWVVICFPISALLWFRGERLRALGRGEKDNRIEGM